MSTSLKKRIGLRVKDARKLKGWSQAQLGEALDKAWETVSNIERGKTSPNFATLYDIALALHTPMRDFFDIEDDADSSISNERQELLWDIAQLTHKLTDQQLSMWLKIGKIVEGEE